MDNGLTLLPIYHHWSTHEDDSRAATAGTVAMRRGLCENNAREYNHCSLRAIISFFSISFPGKGDYLRYCEVFIGPELMRRDVVMVDSFVGYRPDMHVLGVVDNWEGVVEQEGQVASYRLRHCNSVGAHVPMEKPCDVFYVLVCACVRVPCFFVRIVFFFSRSKGRFDPRSVMMCCR